MQVQAPGDARPLGERLFAAVFTVAQDGHAMKRTVCAHLVCAPGKGRQGEPREAAARALAPSDLNRAVERHRALAPIVADDLFAARPAALGQRLIDAAGRGFGPARDQGPIDLLGIPMLEGGG